MKKGWWVVLLFVGLSAAKCDDGCVTEEMRCDGQVLEICNSKNNWESVADCGAITVPESPNIGYACCMDTAEGEFSCMEQEFCNGGE